MGCLRREYSIPLQGPQRAPGLVSCGQYESDSRAVHHWPADRLAFRAKVAPGTSLVLALGLRRRCYILTPSLFLLISFPLF